MDISIKGIGKYSFTIVIVAIIICFGFCFAINKGCNTQISVEKEKIEVNATYSNLVNE